MEVFFVHKNVLQWKWPGHIAQLCGTQHSCDVLIAQFSFAWSLKSQGNRMLPAGKHIHVCKKWWLHAPQGADSEAAPQSARFTVKT
jgi:hypothetical protein